MSVIAHKEEIIRQYVQGEDISALARQYGCHYSWIRNILVRNGINIRAPRYNKSVGRIVHVAGRSRSVFWSKQMEDELRRIFPRSFNAELCEYFGLSQRTILRKARQMGLQKDPEWQHQSTSDCPSAPSYARLVRWDSRRILNGSIRIACIVPGWPTSLQEPKAIQVTSKKAILPTSSHLRRGIKSLRKSSRSV